VCPTCKAEYEFEYSPEMEADIIFEEILTILFFIGVCVVSLWNGLYANYIMNREMDGTLLTHYMLTGFISFLYELGSFVFCVLLSSFLSVTTMELSAHAFAWTRWNDQTPWFIQVGYMILAVFGIFVMLVMYLVFMEKFLNRPPTWTRPGIIKDLSEDIV
jgi:hypothetical protein